MVLDKTWITPAKTGLQNAKRELVYAACALQNTGADFGKTLDEIKQTIGDLEIASVILDDAIDNMDT